MSETKSPFLYPGTGIVITFRESLQWGWGCRSLRVGDLRIPTDLLLAVDFESKAVKLALPIEQFWSGLIIAERSYDILYRAKWFPALFVRSVSLDGDLVRTITGFRDGKLIFSYRGTGAYLIEKYYI